MDAIFQCIKASWGIFIKMSVIEYHLESIDHLPHGQLQISDSIFLSFRTTKYTPEGKRYLCRAIYDNLDVLKRSVTTPTIFEVSEIEYAYSDYQDEGMYCVMVNWLNLRFMLNIALPEIAFDDVRNKYVFDIPRLV